MRVKAAMESEGAIVVSSYYSWTDMKRSETGITAVLKSIVAGGLKCLSEGTMAMGYSFGAATLVSSVHAATKAADRPLDLVVTIDPVSQNPANGNYFSAFANKPPKDLPIGGFDADSWMNFYQQSDTTSGGGGFVPVGIRGSKLTGGRVVDGVGEGLMNIEVGKTDFTAPLDPTEGHVDILRYQTMISKIVDAAKDLAKSMARWGR